jgi:hypothetical protein
MQLEEHLKPLEPLLGRTFRGDLGSDGTDVSRWERAMNGMAVRNLHSVNDGEYCGETIIYFDRKQAAVLSFYFTSAGFYTQARLSFEPGRILAREEVVGNKNGITVVESVTEPRPEGGYSTSSRYLQNGVWIPGHAGTYVEAPGAEVRFR